MEEINYKQRPSLVKQSSDVFRAICQSKPRTYFKMMNSNVKIFKKSTAASYAFVQFLTFFLAIIQIFAAFSLIFLDEGPIFTAIFHLCIVLDFLDRRLLKVLTNCRCSPFVITRKLPTVFLWLLTYTIKPNQKIPYIAYFLIRYSLVIWIYFWQKNKKRRKKAKKAHFSNTQQQQNY